MVTSSSAGSNGAAHLQAGRQPEVPGIAIPLMLLDGVGQFLFCTCEGLKFSKRNLFPFYFPGSSVLEALTKLPKNTFVNCNCLCSIV